MFNQNSFTSQGFVSLFLPFGQGMILGLLERGLAVLMEFCESLVASICQHTNVLRNVRLVILEELKVMFTSMSKGSGHNFGGLLVSNQLCAF